MENCTVCSRRFKDHSHDELVDIWVTAFKEMVSNPQDRAARSLVNDIASEFQLRGECPPYHLVPAEQYYRPLSASIERLRDKIDSRLTARKIGRRTVIAIDDARSWMDQLPKVQPRAAHRNDEQSMTRWCLKRRDQLPTCDRHFVESLILWERPLSPEDHTRLCEIREKLERRAAA
jgi:hypothetical protein